MKTVVMNTFKMLQREDLYKGHHHKIIDNKKENLLHNIDKRVLQEIKDLLWVEESELLKLDIHLPEANNKIPKLSGPPQVKPPKISMIKTTTLLIN
jgi:hypothetical protein